MIDQLAMNRRIFKCDLTDEQIKEFYISHSPTLMHDSNHRQYKLLLRDGRMLVLRKIYRPEQLQKICIEFCPISVYQSISLWLNPERLAGRNIQKDKWANNNFLDSDFIFDLDKEHSTTWNLNNAIGFCSQFKHTIVRTGNGYHFWVFNWRTPRFYSSPFQREAMCLKDMKAFAKSAKEFFEFDLPVSIDTRRIARVPGTMHQSGKLIRILNQNDTIYSSPFGVADEGGQSPDDLELSLGAGWKGAAASSADGTARSRLAIP